MMQMKTKISRYPTRLFAVIFSIICLTICNNLSAQENDSISLPHPVNKATLIGIGSSNLYDTYLSPLEYKGTSIRVFNERMSRLGWASDKFIKQQIIDLELAMAQNPAKTASEYWLMLNYRLGGHYELINSGNFRLRAGALWEASLGVLFNERNGNNPASARAYTNINLSAIAFYSVGKFTFRWQLDTPVAGMLFSPRYGQSYYEISLGNSVDVVNFSSLHNQRALRNYVTVDYPIGKITLRAGYLGSHYQTKVHDINTHTYSNSFVIGFVTESVNISGAKSRKVPKWNSSFY